MNFNNISNAKKLKIIQDARPIYEEMVYLSLINLGINPDSFDPDNAVLEEEEDATRISYKNSLIKALEVLSVFDVEMEKNI